MNVMKEPEEPAQYDRNCVAAIDPLAIICNEDLWSISNVSPLYNLKYEKVVFMQYASKIQQAIALGETSDSVCAYCVTVKHQPTLKYCENDPDALLIAVEKSDDINKTKVYICILLSWGVSCKEVDALDATHLPYMLEMGDEKIGSAIKDTLQTMFDCSITQLHFTQHQLIQFGINFVAIDTSKKTDAFELKYTTPRGNMNDEVELKFEIGDVHLIWNQVKKDLADESKHLDAINMTYKHLQKQILYMVKMDVSLLDLIEICLPKARVKQNGMLKMKTPANVKAAFKILNEIFRCKYAYK